MQYQLVAASLFLVKTLSSLILLLFLLRIVLQWVRADFFNPLSQFVFRATNPLVAPLQRIVPRSRFTDVPALIVLLVLCAVATQIIAVIAGVSFPPIRFAIYVVLRLVNLLIWLYIVSILIDVIVSLIGQGGYNPVVRVLRDINRPVLGFFRSFIPLVGSFDFSPLVALILLQTVAILLPLPALLK
jgi:YggT family protein